MYIRIEMRRTAKSTPYRPALTEYLPMLERIAEKLNETALHEFGPLDVIRLAIERMYAAAFPGEPLPPSPRRKQYHKSPE